MRRHYFEERREKGARAVARHREVKEHLRRKRVERGAASGEGGDASSPWEGRVRRSQFVDETSAGSKYGTSSHLKVEGEMFVVNRGSGEGSRANGGKDE